MNSGQVPGTPQVITHDDITDALLVLHAVARWRLIRSRWADVGRTAAEAITALAVDDGAALRDVTSRIELSGPVRSLAVQESSVPAPAEVLDSLTALIGVLTELESAGDPPRHHAAVPDYPVTVSFPVSIYLGDEAGHEQVAAAVEELALAAGLAITDREDPVLGSWFQRMRARLTSAVQSAAGQDALADVIHRAEIEVVLRPEAEVTALLMANLPALIASLHETKDTVIRVGAMLVVKCDWALYVSQLTTRQQLILDHSPGLLTAPDKILQTLGLPQGEVAISPAEPA
jgi:hypothetical protein